jgi:spore coat polysaccharide biosynthesis protein SpsF
MQTEAISFMKIGAIIQARMGSQRFPGKVLHPVAGKPLLQYLLERLDRCTSLDATVVATSTDPTDAPLESFCRTRGVECFRGDLQNVAQRFRQVLDAYRFEAFVRINGDSPLLDPRLIDRAVTRVRETQADLGSNVLHRTFPRGQSVEVLGAEPYRRGQERMHESGDFEHVTPVFYREAHRFRIHELRCEPPRGAVHLAVDTPEQMKQFAALVAAMDKPHWEYDLEGIIQLYEKTVPVGRAEEWVGCG